jgi:flavodoxin
MKSLVVYSSQAGNTLKLAEAVFEAISGEKKILPVDNALDPWHPTRIS